MERVVHGIKDENPYFFDNSILYEAPKSITHVVGGVTTTVRVGNISLPLNLLSCSF